MDDVLSRNDLRDDEKAKRYFQLQNRYLAFKEQWNTRTRPQEIISAVPDLTSSTQDSSTATAAFSTLLNPFYVTPDLKQAAILQKPEKVSSTPPPPLNPSFLTPVRSSWMLMAIWGNELGIRNFELDLTSTPWAKKMINFHPSQISVFYSLCSWLVFNKAFKNVYRVCLVFGSVY